MASAQVNRPQPKMVVRPGTVYKGRVGRIRDGDDAKYAHERELAEINRQTALETEALRQRGARDLYALRNAASDTTVFGHFSAEAKGGRFRMRGGMKSKHVRDPAAWAVGVGGFEDSASANDDSGAGVRVTDDWWAPRDTWATRDKDGNVVTPEYTGLDLGDMNFPRGNGRFQGGVLDRTFIARTTQQLMSGMSLDDPNYKKAHERARAVARELHNQGLANFQSWARGQRELRDRTARENRMRTREERALEASNAPVQRPETAPAAQQRDDLPPGYTVQPEAPQRPADDGQSMNLHVFDGITDRITGTQAADKGGDSVLSGPALSYFDGGKGEYTGKPREIAGSELAPQAPLPDNIADYSDKDIERAASALVHGTAGKWLTRPPTNVPKQTWRQAESGASGEFVTTGSSGVRSIKHTDRRTGKVSYDVRGTLNRTYRTGDDKLAKRTIADWEARGVGGAGLKSAQANTIREARDKAQIERDVEPLNDELAGRNRPPPIKSLDRATRGLSVRLSPPARSATPATPATPAAPARSAMPATPAAPSRTPATRSGAGASGRSVATRATATRSSAEAPRGAAVGSYGPAGESPLDPGYAPTIGFGRLRNPEYAPALEFGRLRYPDPSAGLGFGRLPAPSRGASFNVPDRMRELFRGQKPAPSRAASPSSRTKNGRHRAGSVIFTR